MFNLRTLVGRQAVWAGLIQERECRSLWCSFGRLGNWADLETAAAARMNDQPNEHTHTPKPACPANDLSGDIILCVCVCVLVYVNVCVGAKGRECPARVMQLYKPIGTEIYAKNLTGSDSGLLITGCEECVCVCVCVCVFPL